MTSEKLEYNTGYLVNGGSECLVYRWFPLKLWEQKKFWYQECQYLSLNYVKSF